MAPPSTNFVLLIMITSLAFLITCCLTSTAAAKPGNETDGLALLAFKAGITSDPLSSLRSWNSTLHFCQWQGVVCSRRHERVVVLNLQARSLAGTISPHIGNLSFLRDLRLRDNRFGGVIPQEIGRLSRLAYLDLTNNLIGGSIPINLSSCSKLASASLFRNQLVGSIPAELGSLSHLSSLGLGQNNLSGKIPTSLGNLSSLTRLSIGRNNLEGSIPDDFGRLTNLGFFQVAGNRLSGLIPPSLYNLSSIYFFSAADNKLVGSLPPNLGLALPKLERLLLGVNQFTAGFIPVSLTNASMLTEVDLSSNKLRGPIPKDLGILKGLATLNVGVNQLGSSQGNDLRFIESLTNCSGLSIISAQGNQLKGPLPNSVGNLSTQLRALALGGNMIHGSIPKGIGNLVNLTLLAMEGNLLVGTIPSSIGNLQQLQVFAFNENKLSGEIPASLGSLRKLSQLLLQDNKLEGNIPLSLGECRQLQRLDLSWNNLNGEIPRQLFRQLSSLSMSLNLAHNSLSGFLPIEIGSLQSLGMLVVSHNRLTGAIPTSLGDCIGLEYLYMDGNSFEGVIPSTLSNLKGTRELDLSLNNLTGQVPAYLGSFQYLNYLNLSYNDLSGPVPRAGVFANASAVSLLGNSNLCGGIQLLQLPACPSQYTASGRKKHHRKLIIVIVCLMSFSMVSAAILFTLWLRKKSNNRELSLVSSEGDQYRRVSYSELFDATNGFSSNNVVGVGSYGTVYRGQLDRDQAPVVVKVLNMQQSGASKSFLAECKALRSVRHRNLVKIITMCSSIDHKGHEFKALVFEFMGNGSLDEWLHPEDEEATPSVPRRLGLLQRLDIAIDVASGLHYLHHCGHVPIVHCDLKPTNILLGDDMTAHVGDFGLARFLTKATSTDASTAQTSSMGIKGTVGYIPPEYGMGGEASTRGDIYSYGILLLEMFTGRRPTDSIFEGDLNLRKFVESTFPSQVLNIVDRLLIHIIGGANSTVDAFGHAGRHDVRKMIEDCLINIVGLGLSCCTELPQERPAMGDVLVELQGVRETFLKKTKKVGICDLGNGRSEGHHHAS
ncbi:hypothetical protein Taro_054666 [Colocasia esculenta]|uniref:Receptor kinase-like protein Xa21 n=1 Tax=Colocasia esculenta TaxID=4460 RepID=A0A843XR66_COLES|nr:hypothetical protein [Colocasia esculenta]